MKRILALAAAALTAGCATVNDYLGRSCGDRLRAEAEDVWAWAAAPAGGPIVFMEEDGLFVVSSIVRDLTTGEGLFPLEHAATEEERLDVTSWVGFSPADCRYLRMGRDLGGPTRVQIVRAPGTRLEATLHERQGGSFRADFEAGASAILLAWRDTAAVWDARTGTRVRDLELGQDVRHVDLSADGSRALLAGSSAVALFDAATGRELARHERPARDVTGAVLGPGGSEALVAAADGGVLLDLRTGEELRRLDVPGLAEPLRALAFAPPPGRRAFGAEGPRGALWDLDTGEVLWEIELPERIDAAAFSRAGDRLILADRLDRPTLLRVSSGTVVWGSRMARGERP